jgi:malate synthase
MTENARTSTQSSESAAARRLAYTPLDEAKELFTPEFSAYLVDLCDRFGPRVLELRRRRAAVLERALREGVETIPQTPADVAAATWQVPAVPEELRRPGIEISGPASITGMFINGLNPGPEGTRAEGDLDDDEDSAGHRFEDTVRAAWNRRRAVEGTLAYHDPEKGKEYRVAPGALPFFMHRERGLALDEPEVRLDGAPVSAAILGTALTLFHAGRAQTERGQGIYFYLPKMESAAECAFWRDFFAASQERLPFLSRGVIRAVPLVESLPAAFQMEAMLHELGPYAAGLNAARWDFQASILEFVMTDSTAVWPDRFGVDIKSTDFLADIFRRLVAICLKRGAVPIGGMATALPSKDESVNRAAAAAIRADKEWEAKQGFLRGWVAHIFHMKTAAEPFQQLAATGWRPSAEMAEPARYPVRLQVPPGPITVEGTRRNARMLLEYLEGWLNGRGAKGIDTLAGKPGVHPALMEDLATARISVAQIAQRVRHGAREAGAPHDLPLVKRLLVEELESLTAAADGAAADRYRRALPIACRWIRSYVDLDYRSLGSYTRADLDAIARSEPVF